MSSKKFEPKSKETINEAIDIILNTETDEAAITFLRETLADDFPELDLGSMDLHEATSVLGGNSSPRKNNNRSMDNLTKALDRFMSQEKKSKRSSKRRTKR